MYSTYTYVALQFGKFNNFILDKRKKMHTKVQSQRDIRVNKIHMSHMCEYVNNKIYCCSCNCCA